ncbi:MAG: hypothetical protein LLF76_02770 [Planctomycetaceae bacterium]|nr:hypothetical protein [Planctomycetaceae bacterium]
MTMPTTAVRRVDMNSGAYTNASLDSLEGVLKDVYLPGFNNTLWFDNKFTGMIEQAAAKLDATGRRIIGAFKTQRSGGVGPMEEGGTFRKSVPVDGIQGWEWLKYSNMYVEFTGPALATVQSGQGSYIDIVDDHMTSMLDSAKLDVERILMGDGSGKIATVVSADAATNVITVKGDAFFDTQFLEPGMWIEVHNPAAMGTCRQYDATATNIAMQITSVTKGNKRTGTNGTITVAQDIAAGSTIAKNDIITREKAYGQIHGAGTFCLEPSGLLNLVSDGADHTADGGANETGDAYKYIWNTDRTLAANTPLKSIVTAIGGELDEESLLTVLIETENQYQANPNLLVVTPRAMLKYFLNTKDDRRFNTMSAMDWVGGYKGMGIQLHDRQLMLTSLNSLKTGTGFLMNTGDFAFIRPVGRSGYQWLTQGSGGILTQKENSDCKFATAVDYWSFTCQKPDKQIKLINITE